MNWLARKVKNLGLIGLVITSALFSCEDPGEIGLQLIENDDDLGVVFANFPIEAQVVLLDSINTTNRGILMTGYFADANFGNVEVQSYLRLLPPTGNPNIPSEVQVADSVKMDLRYSYFFGDDFLTPQSLSIHRLSQQLVTDTTYYSFNSTPFEASSILDTTFMVNPEDTLLSLNLKSIKDELFMALQQYDGDSSSTAIFLEQFKGLTLISDPSSNAILGFNPVNAQSNITLYYTTADTVVNTVDLIYSTYYNQITPDFAGSDLDGIVPLMDFTPFSGNIYLQTGTGIVPKLNFQSYFDFLDNDTTGTIVINKAELVIDNLQGLTESIDPPVQMSFYFADDNNRLLTTDTDPAFPITIQTDGIYISASQNNIDPFNLNSQSVRAQLDTTNVAYSPQITLFLQLIADGQLKREDVGDVIVLPFSFVENPTSIRDNGRSLDRFMIRPEDLRLEISYTRLR